MTNILKLLLLIVFVAGVAVQGESITTLVTGTGFAACSGYCYNSVQINATTITTRQIDASTTNPQPEILHYYSTTTDGQFSQLAGMVGSIQLWKTTDSPIGCPDCQGQGLQWIDVYIDEQLKYGVTFEYGGTVPNYETLVNNLRALHQHYFPNPRP